MDSTGPIHLGKQQHPDLKGHDAEWIVRGLEEAYFVPVNGKVKTEVVESEFLVRRARFGNEDFENCRGAILKAKSLAQERLQAGTYQALFHGTLQQYCQETVTCHDWFIFSLN